MGSPVQEIFQGRGGKKGQVFSLKRLLPLILLLITYLGLLWEFPLTKKTIWFLLSLSTICVYSVLHILKSKRHYSIEFLFSIALLIAGIAQALTIPWFKVVYFPFIVLLTAFYGLTTVISVSLLIPFLEPANFMIREQLVDELAFFLSLIATAGISSLLLPSLKKEKQRIRSPGGTQEATSHIMDSVKDIESYSDELSIHLATVLKTDEDIKEVLHIAKKSVLSDSVHLFVSSVDGLRLRCTTDEPGDIILSGGGLIHQCLTEKRPVVLSDIVEKRWDVGYHKRDKINSLIIIPVIDNGFPLGVITADSARYHAFIDPDRETLHLFSNQIARILQRERIYPQILRSHSSLKVLHEESSKLIASLHTEVISQKFTEGAYRIAPLHIVFFMSKGKEFEITHQIDLPPQERKTFSLKDTLLDMVVNNKEPLYLSDVRSYPHRVIPFKTDTIGSVLALPLLYEKDLIGILVLLSEKTDAINPYQIELLEVLTNQAATSIANARFYSEIEKLAITDALTGLFNYRHFHERLSQELKRLERLREPFSLLIIDIDHFKEVNDTYGHPIGDSVLKGVADKIRAIIRSIDIPARYGGEEFAIILIGADEWGAKLTAERLRRAVKNTTFSVDGKSFTITVSVGISTSQGIMKKEDLIEKADEALYYAKRTGRDRTVVWGEFTS